MPACAGEGVGSGVYPKFKDLTAGTVFLWAGMAGEGVAYQKSSANTYDDFSGFQYDAVRLGRMEAHTISASSSNQEGR
jgi:hypothetical protein